MKALTQRTIAALLLAAVAWPAQAQTPLRSDAPERPAGIASATREDLAHAYVRLETLVQERRLDNGLRARIHRMFDAATPYFYWNRTNRAVEALNAMAALAAPEMFGDASARVCLSLRARVKPRVFVAGSEATPEVFVERLYLPRNVAEGPIEFSVEIEGPDGDEIAAGVARTTPRGRGNTDIRWEEGRSLRAAVGALEPGSYMVRLLHEGRALSERPWYVVARPLSEIRAGLQDRLNAVDPGEAKLERAVELCRARIDLLREEDAPARTAAFTEDVPKLLASLRSEVKTIEAGRDPYREQAGESWRITPGGGLYSAMRLYAPPRLNGDGTHPLVVALHGAGGDEALFMLGYGGGLMKALAEQFGFFLATPRTESFFRDPSALETLVEDLADDYPIDRSRVYLVGHSLGAGAAATLARMQRDLVAAAVCIAGGAFVPGQPVAPTLSIPAELDPIIPAQRIMKNVRRAVEAGARIEMRLAEDQGHTLVVGQVLPAAVKWLLEHRNGDGGEALGAE